MASEVVLSDDDLVAETFQRLTTSSVTRAARCCTVWRRCSLSNAVWQKRLERRFPETKNLVDITNSRALYVRLMLSNPNEHTREPSSLDDYQFLMRMTFDGVTVHAASFHGKDAQRYPPGPIRWYNIENGETGWEEDGGDSDSEDEQLELGPQWLVDLDITWLTEEMRNVYGAQGAGDDPRLNFCGDGKADARSLVDYVAGYTSGVRKDFERSWKLSIDIVSR